MGIIRRSEYVRILEEVVGYIGYAVSQARTGRYSVETRQLPYAEFLMRMNHTQYRDIVQAHIRTALANVIRLDFSTWHTFFFNREIGESGHGTTCQGHRDGSAWARGQAWSIYGTAAGYRYTREPSYVNLFKGVTDYFFRHLPKDLVPFWDLEFEDGDEEPRDSSAASIAACGLLEIARYMESSEGVGYTGMARRPMKSLAANYTVKDYSKSNGLVLHSTYSNHSPYSTRSHYGVDERNLWGDYFYMEALTRICRD